MSRFFWVFGILLLLGTLAGAWFINHNGGVFHQDSKKDAPSEALPHHIICIGYAEPEGGVVKLAPIVPGQVTYVVAEGKAVKKDEILLRVDDTRAKLKVDLAQSDLNGAKNMEAKAKLRPKQHEFQIQQLTAKIESAKRSHQSAVEKLDAELKRAKATGTSYNVKTYEEELKAKEEDIKAVISMLEELKLVNPQADIDAAAELVASKKLQLEEAKFGLTKCELKAPSDGMVLQVFVNANEVLSPLTTTPAILFAPNGPRIVKAEVIQEWANRLEVGQQAVIEDDTFRGPIWKGKVKSIAGWYSNKNQIREPFMMNDQRILSCVVELNPEQQSPPLRIGQRVRVSIVPTSK